MSRVMKTLLLETSRMSRGFVRIHCAYCDAILGWHDIDSSVLGFERAYLCEDCYIRKRPVDVCFHCGISHKHKIAMIDSEYSGVEDEDESILSGEMYDE